MLRLHFNPWSTCHSSAIVFRCQVGTGTAIATEDMNFVTISDQGLNGVPSKILHTVQLGWEWITRQQHTHLFSWMEESVERNGGFFPMKLMKEWNNIIYHDIPMNPAEVRLFAAPHPPLLQYPLFKMKKLGMVAKIPAKSPRSMTLLTSGNLPNIASKDQGDIV